MSETKICPFCGEKIKAEAIKCRFCGEFLPKAQPENKMKKCPYCQEEIPNSSEICPLCNEVLEMHKKSKKKPNTSFAKLIIPILTAIILTVICVCFLSPEIFFNGEYKSITPISKKDIDNNKISAKDAINRISQENKDLNDYLHNIHFQWNKDKLFATFYKNIIDLTETYNNISNLQLGDFPLNGTKDFNGLIIKFKGKSYTDTDGTDVTEYTDMQILKPANLFKLLADCEGGYYIETNNTFLSKQYSKYLGNSWKDYLKIKAKEEKNLNGSAYYTDGYLNPSKSMLTQWIIIWQQFRDKYPKFYMKDEINKNLIQYTSDFMYDTYKTFDFNTNKLKPSMKKDYNKFLENVNPRTEEYKTVNKCFKILKTHNYMYNNEFTQCTEKWNDKLTNNQ